MKHNNNIFFITLIFLLVFLFLMNLWFGSVAMQWRDVFQALTGRGTNNGISTIVIAYRLPQAVTALATGIALGLSGLILQTLFRNPLAGPSVLGISAGASLGVAIAVLSGSFLAGIVPALGFSNEILSILFAFAGALFVLGVILFVSQRIASVVTLLIIGIMMGYAVSAVVGVLQFFSRPDDMYSFVMWGLGSFSKTDNHQSLFLLFLVIAGVVSSLFYIKALNALLSGEVYARSIGYRVKRIRFLFFILTGIFIAATTAYTGPIGFLGLAVPHLARSLFKTSNHAVLIPAVVLTGGSMALLCNLIAKLPGYELSLPINAVTSLIGAPIVIWVLLKNRHLKRNTL